MRGRPIGSQKRFNITYQSMADATGLSINSFIKYASLKKFDPNDLISIVKFVSEYRKRKNT